MDMSDSAAKLQDTTPLTAVILIGILTPVVEELLFRRGIQWWFVRKGLHPIVSILIAAFIFALAHGNTTSAFVATILGTILGIVYHSTACILHSILLHMLNNLAAILLYYFIPQDSFLIGFLGTGFSAVIAFATALISLLLLLKHVFAHKQMFFTINKLHYSQN